MSCYQEHVINYCEFLLRSMQEDLRARGYKLSYHVQCIGCKPPVVMEFYDMGKLDDPTFQYVIVEKRSDRVVGYAKTIIAARRSVDRRDNQYGGYGYRFEDRLRYINRAKATA